MKKGLTKDASTRSTLNDGNGGIIDKPSGLDGGLLNDKKTLN